MGRHHEMTPEEADDHWTEFRGDARPDEDFVAHPTTPQGRLQPMSDRDTYLRDNLDVVLRAVEDMAKVGIEVAKQGENYHTEARDRARIEFVREVCAKWAAAQAGGEAPSVDQGVVRDWIENADHRPGCDIHSASDRKPRCDCGRDAILAALTPQGADKGPCPKGDWQPIEKVLRFYAESWDHDPNGDACVSGDATGWISDPSDELIADGGKRARSMLAAYTLAEPVQISSDSEHVVTAPDAISPVEQGDN